ncbi:AAA family ATPase [Rhodococcus sp. NPDC055112]
MTQIIHLSMRVPWRDRAWDGHVCDRPLDNSSCLLLKNIGDKRDDAYESRNAGSSMQNLIAEQLPCLSERATFMSERGYSIVKTHPYSTNKVLAGTLQPTPVVMPGYAFEAVPFRWLNREMFEGELGPDWPTDYEGAAEDRIGDLLGFTPPWIMDGANQQAVIRSFFEPVTPGESLVFAYLKHSPFQEGSTRKLLVGAARVTEVRTPGMWRMQGSPPFESSMWETAVAHSLRQEMRDGILLPYQQLVPLLENGIDVGGALAWEPEGRGIEFSYVTEHVSNDAAIEALMSLATAAREIAALGIEMPASAVQWVDDQLGRLWQQRGPTPGLGSVLAHLNVRGAHGVSRRVLSEVSNTESPWEYLEAGFADPSRFPDELRSAIGKSTARIWNAQPDEYRAAMRMLSAFDVTPAQVEMIMSGDTAEPLTLEEFLDNPYYAAVCTYTDPRHIPLSTIDRACFPPDHVLWASPLPDSATMDDHLDDRRVGALLVDVLERAAEKGNTVLPQSEVLARVAEVPVTMPCPLNDQILLGLDLNAASLPSELDEYWTPILGTVVGEGVPAYKLLRLAAVAAVIRQQVDPRLAAPRYANMANARAAIDDAIDVPIDDDPEEEAARSEKAVGLAELYASPLSVLIGPAGTGKTTLLRALVSLPGVAGSEPILLAPTGKARVQLQQKVGFPARTLASHLSRSGRYDGHSGLYRVGDDRSERQRADLVVIDEASMLTEEMLAATLDSFSSIKRLVLVGDPRQLPPIGAGRPFVDLVTHLRPEAFDSPVRVGPGYVELQVTRRQRDCSGADLALAKWFGGGELGPDDDAIWEQLGNDPDQKSVRYVSWAGLGPTEVLTDVLREELPLDAHPDPEIAFALTYGGTWNDPYLNWEPGPKGAGERSENWQVLTPTRSRQFGSVEINRHVKRTFRTSDTQFAATRRSWNIPKPIGPELIVRGDKVMHTRNSRMKAWPKGTGLDYVANGEIGVVVGRLSKKKNVPAKVEYSSQVGWTYSYWSSSAEDPSLELAWAVTVHKSQGSEFGMTFVVIPSRVTVSRELLYTALTRHVDRVVILHEGTLTELRDLARPSASETAARLTDLFRPPTPAEITVAGTAHRVDANLVHVTGTGVLVRSKNEVIIADILHTVAPGRWKYEEILTGADGTVRSPDFTVETMLGGTVVWEHLGMLDDPQYAAKWAAKKDWYARNGILPWDKGGGPSGALVWTDDRAGVNVPEWRALAERVLAGETSAARPAPTKKAPPRRRAR